VTALPKMLPIKLYWQLSSDVVFLIAGAGPRAMTLKPLIFATLVINTLEPVISGKSWEKRTKIHTEIYNR